MVQNYQKSFKHMKIDNQELTDLKQEIKDSLNFEDVVDDLVADEGGRFKGSDILEKGDKKLLL